MPLTDERVQKIRDKFRNSMVRKKVTLFFMLWKILES